MSEQEDAGPDRGVLDLRGLLFLFIGLTGALYFYANDDDGTRAAVWLILWVGGACTLFARAFRQEKLAALIIALAGIAAGVIWYTGDSDHLVSAIVLAVAGLGGAGYLMLPPAPK